ncbi:hypothetical protein LINPERHAP2_LOCUS12012 [Linum perenne]
MFDNEGRVVDGRARSFFCGAPICAEATTLLAAVELATRFNVRTVIMSDCLTLTKALEDQPDQCPWEVVAVLACISHLLRNAADISIVHVGRNEVRDADHLAKRSRDEDIADFKLML